MSIDIHQEHVLTLREAASVLPRLRRGRKIHVSTLYRWISKGVGGVRLEATKIGRSRVTSREALQRFADRLASRSTTESSESRTADPAEASIDRRLDELGL